MTSHSRPTRATRATAVLVTLATLLAIPAVATAPARAALAPPPERASDTGYLGGTILEVTPDMDGDGRRDVALLRQKGVSDRMVSTVSVRSGRNGVLLWKRTVTTSYGALSVYPVGHLGPSGKPGIILVATESNDASTELYLFAGAYDGAGHTLWTHSEVGTVDGTGIHDEPVDMAVVTVDGHPDLLIDRFTTHTTAATGPTDASLQPVHLSGVDGSVSLVGEPFAVDAGYGNLTTAPDVNGDGTAEVVGILHQRDADDETVTLRDGATGEDLWTATVAGTQPSLTYVQDVGDVDGDGHADLVVQGYQSASTPLPATLIDGATGAVRWSRAGYAEPIGGGVRALALLGSPVRGVRADDTQLWSNNGVSGYVLGTGDVDGDGTFDLLEYAGSSSTPEVVSSRTGRTLWRGAAAADSPLGVSVDGHGDDLVALTSAKGGARVTVLDGATGHRRWSVVRPGLAADQTGVEAGDVTADHCAEVLLYDGDQLLVLSATDGAVVWRLDPGTGKVTVGRRPARC